MDFKAPSSASFSFSFLCFPNGPLSHARTLCEMNSLKERPFQKNDAIYQKGLFFKATLFQKIVLAYSVQKGNVTPRNPMLCECIFG